jgi:AcrR family transcriptional regulator
VETRRRVGRPSRPVLSRDQIIETAFDVLSETGADDFTMARLAARLGVQTPALYNYVRDRRALVNLMRWDVSSRIDAKQFEVLPWDQAIIPWAISYRQVFATNPHIIALLAAVPIDGTEPSLIGLESIVRSFLRGGWPLARIVPAIVALESFIIGSSLDVLAERDSLGNGAHRTATTDVGAAVTEANLGHDGHEALAPTFARALRAQQAQYESSPADTAFRLGIETMIAGLRLELQKLAEGDPLPTTE